MGFGLTEVLTLRDHGATRKSTRGFTEHSRTMARLAVFTLCAECYDGRPVSLCPKGLI